MNTQNKGEGNAYTPISSISNNAQLNNEHTECSTPVGKTDEIQVRVLIRDAMCYPQVKAAGNGNLWKFLYWKAGESEKESVISFKYPEGKELAQSVLRSKYQQFMYLPIDEVREEPGAEHAKGKFDHLAAMERQWGYAIDDDWGRDPNDLTIHPRLEKDLDDQRWLIYDEKEQILCRGIPTPGLAAYIALLQNNRLQFKAKQANKEVARKFAKIKRDWDLYCASVYEIIEKNWFDCNNLIKPLCDESPDFKKCLNLYAFWRFFAERAERWNWACKGVDGNCDEREMFETISLFSWGGEGVPGPEEFQTTSGNVPATSHEALHEAVELVKRMKRMKTSPTSDKEFMSPFAWETIQRIIDFSLERVKTHGELTKDLLILFPEVDRARHADAPNYVVDEAITKVMVDDIMSSVRVHDDGRTNPNELRYCGDAMLKDDICRGSKFDLRGVKFDHGRVVPAEGAEPGSSRWATTFKFWFPKSGNIHQFSIEFDEEGSAIANSVKAFDWAIQDAAARGDDDFLALPLKVNKK